MSGEPLRAIETEIDGIRFRSRTEARFAILFGQLGTVFEYELDGFILGNGRAYAPDFWLPELVHLDEVGGWVEVKGVKPTATETAATSELGERTGYPAFITAGAPWLIGRGTNGVYEVWPRKRFPMTFGYCCGTLFVCDYSVYGPTCRCGKIGTSEEFRKAVAYVKKYRFF